MVSGTDNKLTYASRTTSVEIVIKKKWWKITFFM
jgi:hypothetical protein